MNIVTRYAYFSSLFSWSLDGSLNSLNLHGEIVWHPNTESLQFPPAHRRCFRKGHPSWIEAPS